MSYNIRSKDNNQFKIAHAWPGLCSLCFDEVAEFCGSDKRGKPLLKRFKINYRTMKVSLNDSSDMNVVLCNDCFTNASPKDMRELMKSEIRGWKREISLCTDWDIDKSEYHMKVYAKKYIVNRRDITYSKNVIKTITKPTQKEVKELSTIKPKKAKKEK